MCITFSPGRQNTHIRVCVLYFSSSFPVYGFSRRSKGKADTSPNGMWTVKSARGSACVVKWFPNVSELSGPFWTELFSECAFSRHRNHMDVKSREAGKYSAALGTAVIELHSRPIVAAFRQQFSYATPTHTNERVHTNQRTLRLNYVFLNPYSSIPNCNMSFTRVLLK